jgi:flagellar biogenesis protein FliO
MDAVRQALSVALVFALLGAALWILKRGGLTAIRPGAAKKTRSLESMERLALTPQHSLHMVRIGERIVVVATHPVGCALLIQSPQERV